MPLSEHEQQLLDQLEKQLRSEDPRFAQTIAQPRPASGGVGTISAKRFVGGALGLIIGAAAAVISIYVFASPWSAVGGVLGFAVMVAGAYWAVAEGGRGPKSSKSAGAQPSTGGRAQSAGFMNRMEDRWEKRRRGE